MEDLKEKIQELLVTYNNRFEDLVEEYDGTGEADDFVTLAANLLDELETVIKE